MNSPGPKTGKKNDRTTEPRGDGRRESKRSGTQSAVARLEVRDEAEFRRWEEIAKKLAEKRHTNK
jgi:hypothetical protein